MKNIRIWWWDALSGSSIFFFIRNLDAEAHDFVEVMALALLEAAVLGIVGVASLEFVEAERLDLVQAASLGLKAKLVYCEQAPF